MIALVPKWAHHYNEFWNAIRSRNLWFIRLRYLFAVLLLLFFTAGEYFLQFNLTSTQLTAIFLVVLFILLYNISIHKFRRYVGCVPGKFNCLHLSLVQMIMDLTSLLLLIYFTGVIESPLYVFAVFQMIIGSLILPGLVVYSTSVFYLILYSLLVILQHNDSIYSHFIAGIYNRVNIPNIHYIILHIGVYWFLILTSVYLTNRIANKLYKREQQLRESLIKNKELEEKKQKYIIGVVHEIKSPIAAIQSMTNMILDDYLGPISEQVRKNLNRLKIRSSEALNLVNNVLYLSRLKILNLTTTEKINVYGLLKELLERHKEEFKAKQIEIDFSDLRKERKEIYADKLLIELAFSNVIGNAMKFNCEGGRIEVRISDQNNSVVIEVSDTGMGIPKEELKNIFHEFYRAANVKRQNVEGSGLGLSLVKEVIDRHFGKITLSSPSKIGSKDHPGTTVKIKLPYASPIDQPSKKLSTTKVDEYL